MPVPDFGSYDFIICAFSGGKDSFWTVLFLIQLGVPLWKIELWHHLVDGRESDLMDWRCTEAYCVNAAKALGVKIYLSWLSGGMEREMLREDAPKAETFFETPDGLFSAGGAGKNNTRLKFPQVTGDLKNRWCSAYLKNHVGSISLRGQDRFTGRRTLFITGERGQESAKRRQYLEFQPHETHTSSRHVDHWRPALHCSEADVWALLQEFCINPHPAYRLGFSRVSCQFCIFLGNDHLATLRLIDPQRFERLAKYERQFNCTIMNHAKLGFEERTLHSRADRGTPFSPLDPVDVAASLSSDFNEPIILSPRKWEMPRGAFAANAGPT